MKNKYLKSAVSFMLAGTMLFGLTACSGGAIAEAGSTGKTDKTEETAKSSSSGDTVKVGILHSQSGTMAMAEKPMIEAAQMAIDEINEDGGVLGKQIEYVLEDGASDAAVFAEKATKLLTKTRWQRFSDAGPAPAEKQCFP